MSYKRSGRERLEILAVLKNTVHSAENSRAKEKAVILPGKLHLPSTFNFGIDEKLFRKEIMSCTNQGKYRSGRRLLRGLFKG